MAYGARMDIYVQRNEDWLRELRIAVAGAAVDLTGWSYEFRLHYWGGRGDAPLLQFTTVGTENGSIIRAVEPTGGAISLMLITEDLEALPGRTQDVARFAYNLRLTDAEGVARDFLFGDLILEPGVGRAADWTLRYLTTEGGTLLTTEDGLTLTGTLA